MCPHTKADAVDALSQLNAAAADTKIFVGYQLVAQNQVTIEA